MLGIRTALKKLLFQKLVNNKRSVFPQIGTSAMVLHMYLRDLEKGLQVPRNERNLGWLLTPPQQMAVWAYRLFLLTNPNHLGNWSTEEGELWGTQNLERQSVRAMIRLYHGNLREIEGYITSGGTEGNLYAIWTGNIQLQKDFPLQRICLLRTSLTHYSIRKAASIVNVRDFLTPLHPASWSMDPKSLEQTITKLVGRGYRGFLIPITLGYTQTGTSDDIETIIQKIATLQHTFPTIRCFLWIDAALSGLVAPFTDIRFSPFRAPNIQAIVVDFHKFGGVPYPAGMVLYRKTLRRLVEQPIDYLRSNDSTVLGSRPGAVAAAIWAVIQYRGKNGFVSLIRQQMVNKKYFLREMNTILPSAQIIHHPQSLSCAVIFPKSVEPVIDRIGETFGLFAKPMKVLLTTGSQTVRMYKFYFLPHMTTETIKTFFFSLREQMRL